MKTKVVIVFALVVIGLLSYIWYFEQTNDISQNDSNIIQHAKHFQIHKTDNGYVLVDGATRKLDINYDRNSITIPAKRLVLFSSTHAAFLDSLNQTEKIVGVAWANSYDWYIPRMQNAFENETIKDIGTADNPSYDVITSLKPDLVVLVGGTGMWENHAKKLEEIGISYVVVSEWIEEEPLGKLEWIKFFGFLTGSQDIAEKIFEETKNKAEKIAEKTKSKEKPSILWAGVFNGIAFVPRTQTYAVNAIIDANANYVFSDLNGTGTATISLEELLVRAKNAQIMVYTSAFVNHTDQITSQYPVLAKSLPIQECNMYSFQPWYWQSTADYDLFAADMAAIAHPDTFPDHQLKLFQKAECN